MCIQCFCPIYLIMKLPIIPILFRDLTDIYKRTYTHRYYKYYELWDHVICHEFLLYEY